MDELKDKLKWALDVIRDQDCLQYLEQEDVEIYEEAVKLVSNEN